MQELPDQRWSVPFLDLDKLLFRVCFSTCKSANLSHSSHDWILTNFHKFCSQVGLSDFISKVTYFKHIFLVILPMRYRVFVGQKEGAGWSGEAGVWQEVDWEVVGEKGWRSNQVPKEAGDLRSPEGGCGLATGEKSLLTFREEKDTRRKMNKLRGGEREGR